MSSERLSAKAFLDAYMKACEDGLTTAELAKQLGLRPASVYQRVNFMKRVLKESGRKLPPLRRPKRLGSLASIVEAFDAIAGQKPKEKKAKKEKEEPESPAEEPEEQSSDFDGDLADILGLE